MNSIKGFSLLFLASVLTSAGIILAARNLQATVREDVSDRVVWADPKDPDTSTMPVFGFGNFYVISEPGTKLKVYEHQNPDGTYSYNISAFADKEAIYGGK